MGYASARTVALFGVAVALLGVVALVAALGWGGDAGTAAASNIGETLVASLSAAVIFLSARRMGVRTSVGRPWLLIALGAASFALGDAIWTWIEVFQAREVPYPGVPDLFYLVEYPLVAGGILSAALAFRGLVSLRRPALYAMLLGVILTVGIHQLLLVPTVWGAPDVSAGERFLSTVYPLFDVWFMLVPSVFVLSVMAQLGGGRLAHPWLAVGIGALMFGAADIGYSWLSASDAYASGAVIDYGWGLGHAFFMLGALLARDLASPVARAADTSRGSAVGART